MNKSVPTYELYGEKSGEKYDFWLHCETIPSRSSLHHWEIRQHRHDRFFQLLYIHAGSGDAILGEQRHAIGPQSVVTVPPRLSHGFRFSQDIEGFVITALVSHLKAITGERASLGEWLSVPHVAVLDPVSADGAYVAQTLLRLGAEFSGRRSGRHELLDAYLTSALQLTARLAFQDDRQGGAIDRNEHRMEMLDGLIRQNLRLQKSAAFYAERLGLSPTHLNRIVRTMTGHGTHEFIARKMIEEAKRELVFTLASVQEIGYRLGFSDPAYFSRFFLKQTGVTPRTWRLSERAKIGV